MKLYGIFSPTLGLQQKIPSILLRETATSDIQDCFFQKGEVWRIKKRWQEFDYIFPDKILNMEYYSKDSTDEWWLLVLTKRDIAYRDTEGNKFVFLNKQYSDGTISVTNGDKTIEGDGTDFAELKEKDFISIGTTYSSDDKWYEIDSITDGTHLELKTAYEEATESGKNYKARITFQGTNTDYWSITNFNEKLIATNNGVDKIIIWTGASQVSDLTCDYKAKKVYSYEQRLLLGHTEEAGDLKPFRMRWSGLNDETDWGGEGSDAGSMELYQGGGVFIDFAYLKGSLIIIKETSVIQGWNVADEIFNTRTLFSEIGSNAPGSIVELENAIYFWGSDHNFKKFDGLSLETISGETDDIVKNINPNYEHLIQATIIDEYNQIWWAIPFADSETLNKILIYDLDFEQNNWGLIDMEVASLGYYEMETTYDWSTLPYAEWAGWSWPCWRHRMGLQTYPIDIMGTIDGKVCRLNASEKDLGNDFTGHIVLETDLASKEELPYYKRLLKIQVYIEAEAVGSLNIHIKRDTEDQWQEAGSVSLQNGLQIIIKDLPVDFLAKVFRIKFSASNRFRLLGVIFYFDTIGVR